MTTPHPDLELLSALVDDVDEDGAGDHVRQCAECQATVQALRQTATVVGDAGVSEISAAQADAAVAAALAAVDRHAVAPVIPITRRRRLPAWVLPAAAAVLIVAAAVPLAGRLSSVGTSQKASTAARSSKSLNKGSAPQVASGEAAATAGGAAVVDLGPINDPARLRVALNATAPAAPTDAANQAGNEAPAPAGATAAPKTEAGGSATGPGAFNTAGVCTPARQPGQTLLYTAVLVWQGKPARVDVQARSDGSRVAVVTDRADCAVLLTLPL